MAVRSDFAEIVERALDEARMQGLDLSVQTLVSLDVPRDALKWAMVVELGERSSPSWTWTAKRGPSLAKPSGNHDRPFLEEKTEIRQRLLEARYPRRGAAVRCRGSR
jgi:hypothetical protein